MEQLVGNTQGLSPAQKRMLERIWRRRVDPRTVVTSELAGFLCECSSEIDRQVGILIDRKGNIEHVIVGGAFRKRDFRQVADPQAALTRVQDSRDHLVAQAEAAKAARAKESAA